jgi:hypothetical protein
MGCVGREGGLGIGALGASARPPLRETQSPGGQSAESGCLGSGPTRRQLPASTWTQPLFAQNFCLHERAPPLAHILLPFTVRCRPREKGAHVGAPHHHVSCHRNRGRESTQPVRVRVMYRSRVLGIGDRERDGSAARRGL